MKGCDRVLVAFLAPPRILAVDSIVHQFRSFLDPSSFLLSLKITNLQINLVKACKEVEEATCVGSFIGNPLLPA